MIYMVGHVAQVTEPVNHVTGVTKQCVLGYHHVLVVVTVEDVARFGIAVGHVQVDL